MFGDKSVHHHEDGYQTFEPGNYFIRVRMLWKQSMRTAVLVGYASEDIVFARMDGDEGIVISYGRLEKLEEYAQKRAVEREEGLGYSRYQLRSDLDERAVHILR